MKDLLHNMEGHHRKQLVYMRGLLDGRGWNRAWEALELARSLEPGYRKDGKTPKYHHQLQVGRLAATLLPHLLFPEETLAACFLHDIREDHPDVVSDKMLVERFGPQIAEAIWHLSKKVGGTTKDYPTYFAELAQDPIASVVKLCDRIHNLHTMQGVWAPEKQRAYADEVEQWFFPMIKAARRNFPRQYAAYENLKITMLIQYQLLFALLGTGEQVQEPQP